MRCHDAREGLLRRLDTDLADRDGSSDDIALDEHLQQCSECREFEARQHHVATLLDAKSPTAPLSSTATTPSASPSSPVSPSRGVTSPSPVPLMMSRPGRVSTGSIMLAVRQQQQISQQVTQIQHQQQDRVARMRAGGIAFAVLAFLALGSVPLLFVAIMLVRTDVMVDILSFMRSIIDLLYVLALSLQTALLVVTHNNLLLSLLAFAVVLMTGMWIRLMRPKRGL